MFLIAADVRYMSFLFLTYQAMFSGSTIRADPKIVPLDSGCQKHEAVRQSWVFLWSYEF